MDGRIFIERAAYGKEMEILGSPALKDDEPRVFVLSLTSSQKAGN